MCKFQITFVRNFMQIIQNYLISPFKTPTNKMEQPADELRNAKIDNKEKGLINLNLHNLINFFKDRSPFTPPNSWHFLMEAASRNQFIWPFWAEFTMWKRAENIMARVEAITFLQVIWIILIWEIFN